MSWKSLLSMAGLWTFAAKALLFVLSCTVALMLGEGVLRVGADRILSEGEFIAVGTVFRADDPPVGYSLLPDSSRIVAKGSAFVMTERISRQGLRDVEHAAEKESGRQRILVLGDSFMYGDGVAIEETMPRQLAGLKPDAEIINAGVRGYDLGQEYLYYRTRGHAFDPDLVILAFFINDLAPDPSMRRVDGPDGLPSFYERKAEVVSREREGTPRGLRGLATSWLRSHSMLYVLATKRFDDWRARRRPAARVKRDNASDIFYLESFRAGTPAGADTEGWVRAYRILDELRRLVTSDGADLMVLMIPAPWQISEQEWDRWVGWLGVEPASLERLKPQAMVRDWCDRSGTLCLDLLEDCREAPEGRLYFRNDHHWTPEGHSRAARCVSATLGARLPGSPSGSH